MKILLIDGICRICNPKGTANSLGAPCRTQRTWGSAVPARDLPCLARPRLRQRAVQPRRLRRARTPSDAEIPFATSACSAAVVLTQALFVGRAAEKLLPRARQDD